MKLLDRLRVLEAKATPGKWIFLVNPGCELDQDIDEIWSYKETYRVKAGLKDKWGEE